MNKKLMEGRSKAPRKSKNLKILLLPVFAVMTLLAVSLVSASETTIENFQSRYDKVNDKVYFEFDEVRNYSTGLPIFTSIRIDDQKGNNHLWIPLVRPTFNRICYNGKCYCSGIGECPEVNPFKIQECVSDEEYIKFLEENCTTIPYRNGNRRICKDGFPYKCSDVKITKHWSLDYDMPDKSGIRGVGNMQVTIGQYYENDWLSKLIEQKL